MRIIIVKINFSTIIKLTNISLKKNYSLLIVCLIYTFLFSIFPTSGQSKLNPKTAKAIIVFQKECIKKWLGDSAGKNWTPKEFEEKGYLETMRQVFAATKEPEYREDSIKLNFLKLKNEYTPSKFESVETWDFITKFCIPKLSDLVSNFSHLLEIEYHKQLPDLDTIHFATIFSNDVTADSKILNNENFIIVHHRMSAFCKVIAKLAVSTLTINIDQNNVSTPINVDSTISYIEKNPWLVESFKAAAYKFLYNGVPIIIKLDSIHEIIANRLAEAMILFALAHEYIHIFKNDYASINKLNSIYELYKNEGHPTDSIERVRTFKIWKQEFLADDLAQMLIIRYYGNESEKIPGSVYFLSTAGIYYLQCLDVLQRCRDIFTYKSPNGDSELNNTIDEYNSLIQEILTGNDSDVSHYKELDMWRYKAIPAWVRAQILAKNAKEFLEDFSQEDSVDEKTWHSLDLGFNLSNTIYLLFNAARSSISSFKVDVDNKNIFFYPKN